MADHYASGRYSSSSGLRFPMWNSSDANDGSLDRWNKSSAQNEVRRDHVCKPVIIGSDGKATPAVLVGKPYYAKDNGAAGYVGRSWADQPTGGDSYPYKSDPYKAQAFIGGVHNAVSADSADRFGLGAGGNVLQRPKADMYMYEYEDDDDRYDQYSSRAEPRRSAEAGRSWQMRKSAEPNWGVGSMYGGGGGARAAVGWGGDGKLSRPTNAIDKAVEFLWDASPQPAGGMSRTDLWGGPQPQASMNQPAKRSSASTIDSREAAKKYGGQFIW